MIINKNGTYHITQIGEHLVLIDDDFYFYCNIPNINILVSLKDNDLIVTNQTTGKGVSIINGATVGVTLTPSAKSYMLLETGDYILLESGGKIIIKG